MAPDDPRHGKVAGYIAKCRCKPCGDAWYRYNKRRTWMLAKGQPLTVPAVGYQRRLRALQAMGWPFSALTSELGVNSISAIHDRLKNPTVTIASHERMVAVYDRLSMSPGPSNSARIRAARKGYPPPLAWDEDTIDDPEAEPYTSTYDKELLDEVVVQRAMSGQPVKATKAERREIIRRWTAAGRPTHKLERILPTANVWRDKREGKAA